MRLENHEADEQTTEYDLLGRFELAQDLHQVNQEGGSDHRADYRSKPADDDHGLLDDHLEQVEAFRRDEAEKAGVERARYAGIEARQRERHGFVGQKIDAERMCCYLAVAHGDESTPDARSHDPPGEEEKYEGRGPAQEVDTVVALDGEPPEIRRW